MNEEVEERSGNSKSRRKRKPKKSNGYDVQWVNSAPNTQDREWLADNAAGLVALFFELVDDLQEGDKLTLKYDTYSNRWVAMYFSGDDNEENAGLALSVRGASAYHSCVLLAYTHLVKFSRKWGDGDPRVESDWG